MVQNQFLALLPEEVRDRLRPHLETVSLEQNTLLGMPGKKIRNVVFPQGALSSIVVNGRLGDSVGAAVVGVEGVTCFPDVLERGVAIHTAIIQIGGEAQQMSADILREEFNRCGAFQRIAVRDMQYMLAMSNQTALCNRAHDLASRLAKWLLLCSDGTQTDVLPLTHEFLATMLGVNRPGVTQSAQALMEAESISYTRGVIRITNRRLLEGFACECYPFLKAQRQVLMSVEGK